MMPGTLAILNVGTGDTKLSFDPERPAEVERAKSVVEDMLKRGYAILVEVGKRGGDPLYQRAKGFDPKTAEYLIVGAPEDATDTEKTADSKAKPSKNGRRKPKTRRIPAKDTTAVAVAPSAGG